MKKDLLAVLAVVILIMGVISQSISANAEVEIIVAAEKESIETRLQNFEDRVQIHQLLMDYGHYLDQRNFAAFSKLFAEKGGEWIGGMGKAKGPETIQKLMEETIGTNTKGMSTPNFHVFANESIKLNGDQASALSKWIFVVAGDANRPQLVYLGHYDDLLVRENGHWKFQKRVVYSDIPADDPLASR